MSQIKVGDLVQVVRGVPCCGGFNKLGVTFKVVRFLTLSGRICGWCGVTTTRNNACGSGMVSGYDVARLKRIPPLEELEGERTEETLREPA